jgi:O-succinylbenzoate synthase
LIEDFCDSEMYKKHPLFAQDPKALQIFLYYDEVELVNPLGSKVTKHKIGMYETFI